MPCGSSRPKIGAYFLEDFLPAVHPLLSINPDTWIPDGVQVALLEPPILSLLAPARATNRPGMLKGKPSQTGTRERIVAAARKAGITFPTTLDGILSYRCMWHTTRASIRPRWSRTTPLIKSNYLDIVTREDAAKFWAIRP